MLFQQNNRVFTLCIAQYTAFCIISKYLDDGVSICFIFTIVEVVVKCVLTVCDALRKTTRRAALLNGWYGNVAISTMKYDLLYLFRDGKCRYRIRVVLCWSFYSDEMFRANISPTFDIFHG